jgi:hypothetical protein
MASKRFVVDVLEMVDAGFCLRERTQIVLAPGGGDALLSVQRGSVAESAKWCDTLPSGVIQAQYSLSYISGLRGARVRRPDFPHLRLTVISNSFAASSDVSYGHHKISSI